MIDAISAPICTAPDCSHRAPPCPLAERVAREPGCFPERYDLDLANAIADAGCGRWRCTVDPCCGSLAVVLTDDLWVYASPGWLGDWGELPIEANRGGDAIKSEELPVAFTGKLDRDVAIWQAIVEPWCQRLLAELADSAVEQIVDLALRGKEGAR